MKNKICLDFLDIILLAQDEDGKSLTDNEILDEVETLLFGGHDMTKSGITFLLYNLARHPDIQAKVREEINNLLNGRDSDEILWDDLSRLTYMVKRIKESYHLHPPVPVIGRQMKQEVVIDGHVSPPGTPIEINLWNHHHHNPSVWGDDHMTFDPERFADDKMAARDPFAYIVFSAGPRNCLGQNFLMINTKVITARLLRAFSVSLDESHDVELMLGLTLHAKDDIKLYFTPFQNT